MFEEIVGQEFAKKRLTEIVNSNRVSNAYIFSGQDGIGKKLMALSFASKIIGINAEHSPDFTLIKPEKDESSIKIEKIRKLNYTMGLKPHGDYRIFLIDEAEKMTVQAQNALLKTLEEPATYGIIILVTKNEQALLETIRSRCVEIKFSPLRDSDLEKILLENGVEKDNLVLPILFSRGSISKALEISKDNTLIDIRNSVEKSINNMIIDKNMLEVSRIHEYLKAFSDKNEIILDIFKSYIRDAILFRETTNENIIINRDRVKFVKKISLAISVSQLGEIMRMLDESEVRLKANSNFNSTIQAMSMNIFKVVNRW